MSRRRVIKPPKPVLFLQDKDGKKRTMDIKQYAVRDGMGGHNVFLCVGGTVCPRTPTQLKLCKQPCNTCVEVRAGETMRDVAARVQAKLEARIEELKDATTTE